MISHFYILSLKTSFYLFLVINFCVCFKLTGQGIISQNSKIFGGSQNDSLINFVRTSDGNFVAIATSNSNDGDLANITDPSSSSVKLLIIKYNSNLDIIWKRVIEDYNYASPIVESLDNSFAFIGLKQSNGESYFIKISPLNGTIITQKMLNEKIEGDKFIVLNNGDFVSMSKHFGTSTGWEPHLIGIDIKIVVLDSSGEIKWTKEHGGYKDDIGVSLFEDQGNIIIFGTTQSNDRDVDGHKYNSNHLENDDIWLLKLHSTDGAVLFQKCLGGSGNEILYDVQKTNSGDYIMFALSNSKDYDITINKNTCCTIGIFCFDNMGQNKWQKETDMSDKSRICIESSGEIWLTNGRKFKKYSPRGLEIYSENTSNFLADIDRPFMLTSLGDQEFMALAHKTNVSSSLWKDNLFLAKFSRSKPTLGIKEISSDWICQNTSFVVSLDTNMHFESNNIFNVIISLNGSQNIVGSSSNIDNIPALSPLNIGYSSNAYIRVESTHPINSSSWHLMKVQKPSVPTLQVPSSVFRGQEINIQVFNNADDGPHSVLINNQWYHTMASSIQFNETIGKIKTYSITAYKDLCGVSHRNYSQSVDVIEKSRSDLMTPPNIIWEKTIGGKRTEYYYDLIKTPDSTFVLLGASDSEDSDFNLSRGQTDVWITKIDENGNKIWTRPFGGNYSDKLVKIINTTDGGFIAVGHSNSLSHDLAGLPFYSSGWVIKIDINGEKMWSKRYGVPRVDNFYGDKLKDIIQTRDGGFVMVGSIDNYFAARKIDMNGNEQWLRKIGNDGEGTAFTVAEDSKGNIWIGGEYKTDFNMYFGVKNEISLIKLSSNGSILKSLLFGGAQVDIITKLKKTSDAGLILVGFSSSNDRDFSGNHGREDAFVMKLDSSGIIEWVKQYGSSTDDMAFSIEEVEDGYIIGAASYGAENGDLLNTSFYGKDAWIFKITKAGTMKWQKLFGGSLMESIGHGVNVVTASNGDYIFGTVKLSENGDATNVIGESDLWIVRLKNIPPCESILTINTILDTTQTFKASETIIGLNKLSLNANVVFSSKKIIELKPGFETAIGTLFKTDLIGCDN